MYKIKKLLFPALVLTISFISACSNLVQIKVDVVDQRTALENQVLGSYQEIDGDLLLLASVRSIDSNGRLVKAPPLSDGRREAIRAMQRSNFNKDDIDRFKAMGALGETNRGYLEYFETKETVDDPKIAEFVKHIVEEENQDRATLYKRIVDINENFSDSDLSQVETVMAGLNRDSSRDGDLIQLDSGKWIEVQKKK